MRTLLLLLLTQALTSGSSSLALLHKFNEEMKSARGHGFSTHMHAFAGLAKSTYD
jgi:hypothetical protein